MDFVTRLPVLTGWKDETYDFILVIINWLIKMVHYKPVKVIFNAPGLSKIILDMIVRHHGLLNSTITNKGLLFISKFPLLLCYFLGIKRRLFIAFHL